MNSFTITCKVCGISAVDLVLSKFHEFDGNEWLLCRGCGNVERTKSIEGYLSNLYD